MFLCRKQKSQSKNELAVTTTLYVETTKAYEVRPAMMFAETSGASSFSPPLKFKV